MPAERPLPDEVEFYSRYGWTLSAYLTVSQVIEHLGCEIADLSVMAGRWQSDEVVTNVFLLACGLFNCIEEYLRGPASKVPSRLAGIRAVRGAVRPLEWLSTRPRQRQLMHMRRWRGRWVVLLHDFLSKIVSEERDVASIAAAGVNMAGMLQTAFPSDLLAERLRLTSPFRHHDLTHHDVFAMAERYIERAPDRDRKILLVGLRTSGSYFVPLLRAFLSTRGYRSVFFVTLNPKKGAGTRERKEMARYAEQGYSAVIVDDSPDTGGTILAAITILRRVGFTQDKLKILVPAHRGRPNLLKHFPDDIAISLEPDQWRKRKLFETNAVHSRLTEYFNEFVSVSVVASKRVEDMNAELRNTAVSDERGAPLKQIFEVHLRGPQGRAETRFVLAKSVGWGWLGYHAFLAGCRLSGFVPPMLGLREGVLYTEWIPNVSVEARSCLQRHEIVDVAASYIAARTRELSLEGHASALIEVSGHDSGARLLKQSLSNAYGTYPINIIARSRIQHALRQWHCPNPTLIDCNMRRNEWVFGESGLLKIDYERHGLGKSELNIVDPAYDLAEFILDWELQVDEERRLVKCYIDESGDADVERRLMLCKVLAGLWAMDQARDRLFCNARPAGRQQALHRQFMAAWDFLTIQFARFCGSQYVAGARPQWNAPLVFTDVDGVLDRRLFGFPSTSAAGIAALGLLRSRGVSVALNTARSVSEVKAYCEAYSLAGGVAEHGGYIWDAVNQRGRALISQEAAAQLDALRSHLRQIPGVFLDDRHQYSIRAFAYRDEPRGCGDGLVAPVSMLLIGQMFADLGLDRLSVHHNVIDTTIASKEVDKGSGLLALRDWVLGDKAETVAIGEGHDDLAMFRVASRSFAPSNIACGREAQLFGCKIVGKPYQRGLLEIAQILSLPEGERLKSDQGRLSSMGAKSDLLLELLRVADQSWGRNLMRIVGV